MVTEAVAAYGTLLQMGDGGDPETFTTVAAVRDIRGPGLRRTAIDVTSHTSANGFEEVVPGVKRSGEVVCTVSFVPTNATQDASTGLWAKYEAGTRTSFRLVLPSGLGQLDFAAYVTGIEPAAPVDGALEARVALKLTGPVTLT